MTSTPDKMKNRPVNAHITARHGRDEDADVARAMSIIRRMMPPFHLPGRAPAAGEPGRRALVSTAVQPTRRRASKPALAAVGAKIIAATLRHALLRAVSLALCAGRL